MGNRQWLSAIVGFAKPISHDTSARLSQAMPAAAAPAAPTAETVVSSARKKAVVGAFLKVLVRPVSNPHEPAKPLVGSSRIQVDSCEATRGRLSAMDKSLYALLEDLIFISPDLHMCTAPQMWKVLRARGDLADAGGDAEEEDEVTPTTIGGGGAAAADRTRHFTNGAYPHMINVKIERRPAVLVRCITAIAEGGGNLGKDIAVALCWPMLPPAVADGATGDAPDDETRLANARLSVVQRWMQKLADFELATRVVPAARGAAKKIRFLRGARRAAALRAAGSLRAGIIFLWWWPKNAILASDHASCCDF